MRSSSSSAIGCSIAFARDHYGGGKSAEKHNKTALPKFLRFARRPARSQPAMAALIFRGQSVGDCSGRSPREAASSRVESAVENSVKHRKQLPWELGIEIDTPEPIGPISVAVRQIEPNDRHSGLERLAVVGRPNGSVVLMNVRIGICRGLLADDNRIGGAVLYVGRSGRASDDDRVGGSVLHGRQLGRSSAADE